MSTSGFISLPIVSCIFSKSLCRVAFDSPNSPIFPMIACCSLSIVPSILFSLSSISFILSCV